jgi:hypothetical protein
MDESVKRFVERQNVIHYVEQLKIEPDPVKRSIVLKLLGRRRDESSQSFGLKSTLVTPPRCAAYLSEII